MLSLAIFFIHRFPFFIQQYSYLFSWLVFFDCCYNYLVNLSVFFFSNESLFNYSSFVILGQSTLDYLRKLFDSNLCEFVLRCLLILFIAGSLTGSCANATALPIPITIVNATNTFFIITFLVWIIKTNFIYQRARCMPKSYNKYNMLINRLLYNMTKKRIVEKV